MKPLLLIRFCFLLAQLCIPHQRLNAQRGAGMIDDDASYKKQSVMTPLYGNTDDQAPRKINLKPYCPIPGNQGSVFSCVGWAIGFGAMTVERAVQKNQTDPAGVNDQAYSALFIYNQVKEMNSCKSGARMTGAMEWLKTNGDCYAKDFDQKTNDCQARPDIQLSAQAKDHTIRDYVRLFDVDDGPGIKINRIRQLLSKNKPVVVSIRVNLQFQELKNARVWNPSDGDEPSESHALLVVGYDDAAARFTLMNSWGTGWGDGGFIEIAYKDLAACCRYAYVLYLSAGFQPATDLTVSNGAPNISQKGRMETTNGRNTPDHVPGVERRPQSSNLPASGAAVDPQPVEMAGKIAINHFTGFAEDGTPHFERAEAILSGRHYQLAKKDWQVGDKFQLALTSALPGAYLYVVSFDANNETKILFPHNEEYGPLFKDMHESALLTLDGTAVYLPHPKKVMKIDATGKDHLCIFFSAKKIRGFKNLCEQLNQGTGLFEDRIQALLNNMTIPAGDVNYENNQISFSGFSRGDAVIIPIVIEVEAK